MLPTKHFIFGLIFAGFLYFIFPKIGLVGFLIIIFSTFLIDVDHYLYYVYRKKDFSLRNAYKWFIKQKKKFLALPRKQRNKFQTGFCFLHGIEILIILFLLGIFISKYFYFILIGFAFHLVLDIIYQRTIMDRLDRISIIYDFFKFKRLRFIEELKDLGYDVER